MEQLGSQGVPDKPPNALVAAPLVQAAVKSETPLLAVGVGEIDNRGQRRTRVVCVSRPQPLAVALLSWPEVRHHFGAAGRREFPLPVDHDIPDG